MELIDLIDRMNRAGSGASIAREPDWPASATQGETMAGQIEDYAIIGDTETVALIDKGGSIDWWCTPRIDSGATFAALLGTPEHGRWLIGPSDADVTTTRRYRRDTLVLETVHETATGSVAVIDFMSPRSDNPTIFRVVEGRSGLVHMTMELVARFDYGSIVPWVTETGDGLTLIAGEDGLQLHSPVLIAGQDMASVADFAINEGEQRSFSLAWFPALESPPLPLDAMASLRRTEDWWRAWVSRCTYQGEWREDVIRSLITLKALTYAPTGAVCAAATTSLPEWIGSVRNWDYRYSWLRDSSFTLQALLLSGYGDEAMAWYQWLRRAVAGSPGDFQIMYGVRGERRLTEIELDWLPGYEGSKPVRVGNQASEQFQLDVFGEVMDAAWTAVSSGVSEDQMEPDGHHGLANDMIVAVMAHLDEVWDQPDDGIWEIRGPRRHFTHSKVMAWVAYDRAVKIVRTRQWPGIDVEPWIKTRDLIHAQICEQGWNEQKQSFTQYYGCDLLDSSLLMLARMGFLPPTDPRLVSTIEAIQRELVVDGFVQRYSTAEGESADGLPPGDGAFLLTTFWLADNLSLIGRHDEAREIFERLATLRNDVGLFSEEYDPQAKRMLGNLPQAFSHLAHIITAAGLSMGADGPLAKRMDDRSSALPPPPSAASPASSTG
jgi:GH15 family glucan-1,4-alpha-glucosidase